MKKLLGAVFIAFLLLHAPKGDAQALSGGGYNGFGQCTRPGNTTSYGAGAVTKLWACMNGANVVPMTINVNGAMNGSNLITGARMYTTGTGASGATFKIHLFSTLPTIGSLVDQGTYVGPYAADLSGYIGTLTCGTMTATNDASATYYSECSISNLVNQSMRFPSSGGSNATLYGMVEDTTGYVPISAEQISLWVSTVPVQ